MRTLRQELAALREDAERLEAALDLSLDDNGAGGMEMRRNERGAPTTTQTTALISCAAACLLVSVWFIIAQIHLSQAESRHQASQAALSQARGDQGQLSKGAAFPAGAKQ